MLYDNAAEVGRDILATVFAPEFADYARDRVAETGEFGVPDLRVFAEEYADERAAEDAYDRESREIEVASKKPNPSRRGRRP